jgi:hypothetical protein
MIPEARPYTFAELELEGADGRFMIRRALQGGAFELYNLDDPSSEVTILGERLNRNDPNNISTFLLSLAGLDGKRVRKNADNALQDLSFRNLARLIMVDEQDIIKVTSPIHGGEATQLTAETNTFKLVLTGQDDSALVEQKKKAVAKAELEGQLELLDKLSKAYNEELGDKPASPADLNDQLDRLTQTLASTEASLREQRESAPPGFTFVDNEELPLTDSRPGGFVASFDENAGRRRVVFLILDLAQDGQKEAAKKSAASDPRN